jgi:hypothetical protein
MPRYESADRPSDLIRQYELAREAHKVSKGSSKDAPHIRFANSFGPSVRSLQQLGPIGCLITSSKYSRVKVRRTSRYQCEQSRT